MIAHGGVPGAIVEALLALAVAALFVAVWLRERGAERGLGAEPGSGSARTTGRRDREPGVEQEDRDGNDRRDCADAEPAESTSERGHPDPGQDEDVPERPPPEGQERDGDDRERP